MRERSQRCLLGRARSPRVRSACFSLRQGELPLNAIQVFFEENEKTSFLIEGACPPCRGLCRQRLRSLGWVLLGGRGHPGTQPW